MYGHKSHQNILVILIAISAITIAAFYILSSQKVNVAKVVSTASQAPEQLKTLLINDVPIPVEIAETDYEMRLGLGERDSLPAERGMLFVYPEKVSAVFWMKGMRFALDIIWIADDKVVRIDEDVPYEGGAAVTRPSGEPINYVLEVNAGFTKEHGIAVGDQVVIPD